MPEYQVSELKPNKLSTKCMIFISTALSGYCCTLIFMLMAMANMPLISAYAKGEKDATLFGVYLLLASLSAAVGIITWKLGTKEPAINKSKQLT